MSFVAFNVIESMGVLTNLTSPVRCKYKNSYKNCVVLTIRNQTNFHTVRSVKIGDTTVVCPKVARMAISND